MALIPGKKRPMNRHLPLVCFCFSLTVGPLFSTVATAQVAVPKVGVIDLDDTLSSTPAGKRASDAFEATRKAKQAELDKQQEQLKTTAAGLDNQKAALSADVYQQRRQELEKRFVELQQTYVKLEKDLAGERTKLVQDLLRLAEPKIEAIAKAEGVSIIVRRDAVVWSDAAVDLTPKLKAQMK